jgi:hypothetical protein
MSVSLPPISARMASLAWQDGRASQPPRAAAGPSAGSAVAQQDRRATHVRSDVEVRRGPSHSHGANLTPWRTKQSALSWNAVSAVNVMARRKNKKTRIIGTERHAKKSAAPTGRLTDDELFGRTRTKVVHVPPCKAELHRGQCYESELRPWRHAHWTGVPSPPLPRRVWRKAPTGVLSGDDHPAAAVGHRAQPRAGKPGGAARMSLAATVAVGISSEGSSAAAADSGIRRFMTREQDVMRALGTKFPRLGVSVKLLERFLAEHEAQLQEDEEEAAAGVSREEKISKLYEFFNLEGELAAGKITAVRKTLTALSASGGSDRWFTVWTERLKLAAVENRAGQSQQQKQQPTRPVSREQFALIYSEPDGRGSEQLEADYAFLFTTFAVTRTLIKPLTAETPRDCYARLHLNERDENGAPLVGEASVFFSHAVCRRYITCVHCYHMNLAITSLTKSVSFAVVLLLSLSQWQYKFVTMIKTVVAHLRALEAKQKSHSKQPLFAWIDIMSMPQHDVVLPASTLHAEEVSAVAGAPATGRKKNGTGVKVGAPEEDATNASLKWAMVFANAVGKMKEMVLILDPWDNPAPLGRTYSSSSTDTLSVYQSVFRLERIHK